MAAAILSPAVPGDHRRGTAVKLDGVELPKGPYAVMGFSAQGEVSGPMVVAGYGGNNLWTHYEMIYLHGSSDFASWRDAR